MKNHIWNAAFLVLAILVANYLWGEFERMRMKRTAQLAADIEAQEQIQA